ncbi:cardiolipin synthase [Paenibacillus sp. J5C_2022]|uniref:cardiolipin synthase n=1 Tax=Paenibacillus sp. J5C2022 TaxID=2977129 RepID=UPI0021CF7FAA|nr:cardiolipin synthase [Paenibacillus sp. J5C2022]MCU6709207.1 cardiolipin synthase [Paenibacillus sp. J5C2022]
MMAAWLTVLFIAYILQIAVILLLEYRRQAHMTAWLFIVLLCPFLGFAAYWLAGSPYVKRRERGRWRLERYEHVGEGRKIKDSDGEISTSCKEEAYRQRLLHVLERLSPFPLRTGNRCRVLTDGEATFDAIEAAMKRARHHIHLDYYTIRHDRVGKRFLRTLIDKARKGVEVRVLYDGIGSMHLDRQFIGELKRAGGQAHCFSPAAGVLRRRLNYRNHRKIVIVDGATGFLGGINIGEEYIGLDPKLGFWRDTHLQLKGEAVYDLQRLFMSDWRMTTGEVWRDPAPYMPEQTHQDETGGEVIIVPGTPGMEDQKIVEVLVAAMSAATTRIYAATPYFIPDPAIASALRIAARSGVDVRLIIPGISDSKLVLLATLSHMTDMLEAGVKVYRYGKGFIHSKVVIIDEMLASVGTANLDMRSFYSNYELLALLFDKAVISRLENDFMQDLQESAKMDAEAFSARPMKQKLAEAVMHIVSPLL